MSDSPAADGTRNDYAGEVRFGVVMYGGVSLAIYINGVANELYEMCCATPKVVGAVAAADSTRAVYRRLSWLLRDEGLRQAYLQHLAGRGADPFGGGAEPLDRQRHTERQRLVVDVVAGTSAGGINGIFLAKALANGEAFAPLKNLWIQEGDIGALLNDEKSWTEEIAFADRKLPPNSLLNSDRMYLKLLSAMREMKTAVPGIGQGESALADEIDLFVTTTDIRGAVVPIRLFDKVVYERRHKQVYHFKYNGAGGRALGNDFGADNHALLAFSARCTSSFPFAFEPMQVADAARLAQGGPDPATVRLDDWKPYFTGLSMADLRSDRWHKRAFGDGGYLDNKPFSYAVEALSWRLASVPIERKLIYVEPKPAHPEREAADAEAKPDAIENAIAALTKIPQYETIREDLEAVLKRNRRIERVERLVRKVEADVDAITDEPFERVMIRRSEQGEDRAEVPDWASLDLGGMIRYYGAAFLPYWRLRLTTVSDDVADRLADRWGVDRRSDHMYAMRALVRAWRERHFYEHRSEDPGGQRRSINAFMAEFDVKYRVRRAGFLLRRTHMLLRLAQRWCRPADPWPQESASESALRQRLQRRVDGFDSLRPEAWLAAVEVLRGHIAAAQGELRRQAWPPGSTERSGTDAQRHQLDQVLALLMGETVNPPLTELASQADPAVTVPLKLGAMPQPSPLRTLQENVYARAQLLYSAADIGRTTQLQHLLEQDIEQLRLRYTAPGSGAAPLVKTVLGLGQPTLLPVPAPTLERPDRLTIEINLEDTAGIAGADTLNTREGRALRRFLAEYYLRFDEYDQVSFPLYYDTGTGEPSTVEVVRISPEDAPSLIDEGSDKRRKLAGTFLFNFGGFLDQQWRRNDIMWGRLDACERLLLTLLPADAAAEAAADLNADPTPQPGAGDADLARRQVLLRRALLGQAQRAILKQEMTAPYYDELRHRFAQALQAQQAKDPDQAFAAVLQALQLGDDQQNTRWALALKAVLQDEGLFDFVKQHYEVRRELDTETALKTGARALAITGRILEQIEKRKRAGGSRAVWVTRAGRAAQALLTVATPGSLAQRLTQHWLAVLYAFEIVVALGAVLLNEPTTRNFALSALGITLVVQLAALVVGDLLTRAEMRQIAARQAAAAAAGQPPAADTPPRRTAWALRVAAVVGAGALVLSLLGVAAIANHGVVATLCGPATSPVGGLPGRVCGWLR